MNMKQFDNFVKSDVYSLALVLWEVFRRVQINGKIFVYLFNLTYNFVKYDLYSLASVLWEVFNRVQIDGEILFICLLYLN